MEMPTDQPDCHDGRIMNINRKMWATDKLAATAFFFLFFWVTISVADDLAALSAPEDRNVNSHQYQELGQLKIGPVFTCKLGVGLCIGLPVKPGTTITLLGNETGSTCQALTGAGPNLEVGWYEITYTPLAKVIGCKDSSAYFLGVTVPSVRVYEISRISHVDDLNIVESADKMTRNSGLLDRLSKVAPINRWHTQWTSPGKESKPFVQRVQFVKKTFLLASWVNAPCELPTFILNGDKPIFLTTHFGHRIFNSLSTLIGFRINENYYFLVRGPLCGNQMDGRDFAAIIYRLNSSNVSIVYANDGWNFSELNHEKLLKPTPTAPQLPVGRSGGGIIIQVGPGIPERPTNPEFPLPRTE
jgi:hypothetical protein